ncbi:MAG: NAD/NADP octopine/nopaline dehydrogenase family protein [Fibrobacter sp.]|nr:NAD/NADP octopine/nopaline dehydrogenase family protein [Fibrobacter sp.]
MNRVTICGGGSLGHVCIGVLSSQEGLSVGLLTSHPEKWNEEISVVDVNGKVFRGHLDAISSKPQEVIPDADVVLLCMPGFLIKQTLEQIKPFLSDKTIVGSIVSSTGFFFFAHDVLGVNAKLFGFQRVPFIARVAEYGKSANLLGYKASLNVAVENVADREGFRAFVEKSFCTPVSLLQSFYEACLTNSNPILHTGRLYSMWHDWDGTPYNRCILFYKEWTEDAAQWLIDMDAEFMNLLEKLPMNQKAVPSLLEYYESTDAKSLSAKLRSIKAFESIKAPMKEVAGGWVPDFESRYFTEDFPYGLRFIVDLARKYGVETPKIDVVYNWGLSIC